LVVVHRVFYSHFIISLKRDVMVATTFLYIIIILCYVNKLNSSMSNYGGREGQPKKMKLILFFSFLFFCQHNSTGGGFLILKQIICILMKEFSIPFEMHMSLHITIVRLTGFGVLKRFC
jgi:hypothetical protein